MELEGVRCTLIQQLEDNRDCVLCMTCLKACPHRSVELVELNCGRPMYPVLEVALLFLLLGGVFLHRLPELQTSLGLNIDLTQFWPHLGLSLLTLSQLVFQCLFMA